MREWVFSLVAGICPLSADNAQPTVGKGQPGLHYGVWILLHLPHYRGDVSDEKKPYHLNSDTVS